MCIIVCLCVTVCLCSFPRARFVYLCISVCVAVYNFGSLCLYVLLSSVTVCNCDSTCAPFSDQDVCKLYCFAEGYDFFFALSSKVRDGTLCTQDSSNVCIDGMCEVTLSSFYTAWEIIRIIFLPNTVYAFETIWEIKRFEKNNSWRVMQNTFHW